MDCIGSDISIWRRVLSAVIFFPFRFKKKHEIPKTPSKILVIQWGYLGDIITSTPAFGTLRLAFPSSEIRLLTNHENKGYVNGIPYFNEILYFNNPFNIGRTVFSLKDLFKLIKFIRGLQSDILIEFSGRLSAQVGLLFFKTSYRAGDDPGGSCFLLDKRVKTSSGPQIERALNIIRALLPVEGNIPGAWNPITENERIWVNQFRAQRGISSFAVVHPTASWKPGIWPQGKWVEVIESLYKKNYHVVLIGTLNEFEVLENIKVMSNDQRVINLAGKTDIPKVLALMERAEIFVGHDSGAMHLSAIAGLRGVILFGPGDPLQWSYPIHEVVYKKQSCSPCPKFAFKRRCKQNLKTCRGLTEISSQEVIEKCRDVLDRGVLKKIEYANGREAYFGKP